MKNDATSDESPIVLRTGTVTGGMLWMFEKGEEGYKIVNYTSSGGTDYVLATATSSATNGTNLILGDYVPDNNSYRDEWGVISSTSLVLFGIPDDDDADGAHDHSSALENVRTAGGWKASSLLLGETTAAIWRETVANGDVYISRSHGTSILFENGGVSRTGILLNDEPETEDQIWLFSHYGTAGWTDNCSYIDIANEDYSNVRIALFVGCETGAGGEGGRNLPQRLVDAGAEVSIGFTVSINCGAANTWTQSFYEHMLRGKTVEEAVISACADSNNLTITKQNITICGNKRLTLVK